MPDALPRFVSLALRAYPRRFRSRFGADLGRALAERWHLAGASAAPARMRARAHLVGTTIVSGLAERGVALQRQSWRTHRRHLYTHNGRHRHHVGFADA